MSVAEALARAREVSALGTKPNAIPSLLYDSASAASAVSRSELAGLALNGLDSLASVDSLLPTLYEPLLLLDPRQDRATLEPSRAAKLSAAVVSLATRLAPVFPLRHAQKALEWVVRGLNVSTLGSDDEVNAILLAALPFHATLAFAKLARAVLSHGPTRRLWTWLQPVVKQRKPPALSFLISNIPYPLLYAALDVAVVMVKSGVSTGSLSTFLANVVARRLATTTTPATERRILMLRVLDTIGTVRKEKSPSKRKAQADVLSALFMAVAAGILRGIEEDVSIGATQVACSVLLKVHGRGQLSDIVLTCLALLITRAGVSRLPLKSASYVVSSGILPEILPKLEGNGLMEDVYLAFVRSVIPEEHFGDEHVDSVVLALSVDAPEVLTNRVVATAITSLLHILSLPTTNDQEEAALGALSQSNQDRLVSMISKLAVGRYSSGMDVALRNHFNGRTRRKSDKARYSRVDVLLTASLSGTSFQILKGQSTKRSQDIPTNTFLEMLSHPEPSVRRGTLERLTAGEILLSDSDVCKQKLATKLSTMLLDEGDPSTASLALAGLLKLGEYIERTSVLKTAIKRFRADFAKLRQKKKTKFLVGVQTLGKYLVSHCEQLADKKPLHAFAAVIGLIVEDVLAPHNGFENSYERALGLLVHKGVENNPFRSLKKLAHLKPDEVKSQIVSHMQKEPRNCLAFLKALTSWEPHWGTKMVRLWLLESASERVEKPSTETSLLEVLVWIREEGLESCAEMATLAIDGVSAMCKLVEGTEARRKILDQLWMLCASGAQKELSRTFLQKVVSLVGLDDALDMLQRVISSPSSESTASHADTLRWYLFISSNSKLRARHSTAVLILLQSYFGDESKLREEVIRIAKARKEASSTKKRRKNDIEDVLSIISDSSTGSRVDEPSLPTKTRWTRQLREFIHKREVYYGHPPPILSSAKAVKEITDRIIDNSTDKKERLFLLRAFESFQGIGDVSYAQFWKITFMLLKELIEGDDVDETVMESLARIVLLLSDVQESRPRPPNLMELAKLANSQLKISKSLDLRGQASLANLQLVVLSTAVAIFRDIPRPEAASFHDVQAELLKQFLYYSVKSSAAGDCARQIVDQARESELAIGIKDCMDKRLVGMISQAEGNVEVPHGLHVLPQDDARQTWLGAVESLRRSMLTKTGKGFGTTRRTTEDEIIEMLWTFVTDVFERVTEKTVIPSEELEYESIMVVDVLKLLHQRKEQSQRADKHMEAIVDVMFYTGVNMQEVNNASAAALRNSALKLTEVLIPGNEKAILGKLETRLEEIVRTKSPDRSLSQVRRVARMLLNCGCGFDKICRWLVNALYRAEVEQVPTEDHREIVVSCCRLLADVQSAATTYVREMFRFTTGRFSKSFVAQECSLFLLSMELNALEDINTLSRCDSTVLGEVVKFHVLHPNFLAKLLDIVELDQNIDRSAKTPFTELFLALLRSEDETREAMATLLAVLPVQLLEACAVEGLLSETADVRVGSLRALVDRLEADELTLSSSWNLTNAIALSSSEREQKMQSVFVNALTQPIRNIIEKGKDESARSAEVELAIRSLEMICRRMGSTAPRTLLECFPLLLSILQDERFELCLSDLNFTNDYCRVVSQALRCMSSMIAVLKKHTIAFTPSALARSVKILQSIFEPSINRDGLSHNQTSLIMLAEAAVRVCTSVLETNPKFFGRVTLQSIMSITITSTAEVLNELMLHAVQKVPSGVFVASVTAVSQKFASIDPSLQGVRAFLKGLEAGIKIMRKSELKLQCERLISASQRCLEYKRDIFDGSRSNDVDDIPGEERVENEASLSQVTKWHLVDEEHAHAMIALVLRLSESEFKPVFKNIVQWSEEGQLAPGIAAAARGLNVTVPHNLLRALPFYRLSLSLFQTLQSLYVPYFFQLIDKVLEAVGSNGVNSPSKSKLNGPLQTKKRSRSTVQEEDDIRSQSILAGLHSELREACLDNLICFLKQDLDEAILTSTVVSKIQASLIKAFDEERMSHRVGTALNGLATCIVALGNGKESKEDSRDLLKALSREILLRTRSEDPTVREASLQTCKSMTTVVGNEFLVALPEAMPILSEVIDDEDASVQRAAKAFAHVLEDLAGEPILSELK